MILDKILVFGDDDAMAAITSTAALQDFYADMGQKKNHTYHLTHKSSSITSNDYGEGGDLWYNVLVTTRLLADGSTPSFTVSLVTHSSATSLASGTVLLTKTIASLHSATAVTDGDAGDYMIRAKVPTGCLRYIGSLVACSADKMASGNITSWLSYGTATEIES